MAQERRKAVLKATDLQTLARSSDGLGLAKWLDCGGFTAAYLSADGPSL